MESSNTESIHPSRPQPIPTIRLAAAASGPLVNPADPDDPGSTPFMLPRLPLSLLAWATTAAEAFWLRDRRCLALLLTLDVERRRWATRIPPQRCGRDAACWTADRRGCPGLREAERLAGTFQSVAGGRSDPGRGSGGGLRDVVPSIDGLHLVQQLSDEGRAVALFLRVAGTVHEAPLPDVTFDDWLATLDAHRDRLRFV